jgi:hypothetical protein
MRKNVKRKGKGGGGWLGRILIEDENEDEDD